VLPTYCQTFRRVARNSRQARIETHLCERKGLPVVRFHDLRHAAGSNMLKYGVPMHVVSRILGHSTIATTVNIYGHVEDEALDDAAAAQGRALGS
jgi:integrase